MSISAETSTGKLKDAVTLIDNCSSSLLNVAQITSSLKSLDESFLCVATLNDLPTACDNTGRFIYVQSIEAFRYSDGYDWLMNACSVLGNVNTATALWTWGRNSSGILGDGTIVNRCSPGTIFSGGTNWCQVSGGTYHTAAIKTDGTLWTWGSNTSGILGNGTTVDRCSPGTVWGSYTTWRQVSLVFRSSSAIKTDGTLWTWGSNIYRELGDGTTVSRCSPGTVAGGGTTWCLVGGTRCSRFAIKTDGTLWTWGTNSIGQLGDGTTVSRNSPGTIFGGGTNWCQVSGGYNHNVAIKCDGTLWTWGANSCGALGDGTTVSRCSPGTIFGGGTNWCQVSGGRSMNAAIKTDGTLWTWGSAYCGQLGNGIIIARCSPGTVAGGGTTWCRISLMRNSTLALKSRGF